MDKLTQLLQETKPLYLHRKNMRRMVGFNCVALTLVAIITPAVFNTYNRNMIASNLYAELYITGDDTPYYIDEFDALGII